MNKILLTTLLLLGACAQGRRALSSSEKDEVWAPQQLCQNVGNSEALGCFQILLDITQNYAEFDVQKLGFDPGQTPYRILARRTGDGVFNLLADGVTATAGGTIQVPAAKSHFIEEYEEWRVELSVNYDQNNYAVPVQAGQGVPVAQAIFYWPELESSTQTQTQNQ